MRGDERGRHSDASVRRCRAAACGARGRGRTGPDCQRRPVAGGADRGRAARAAAELRPATVPTAAVEPSTACTTSHGIRAVDRIAPSIAPTSGRVNAVRTVRLPSPPSADSRQSVQAAAAVAVVAVAVAVRRGVRRGGRAPRRRRSARRAMRIVRVAKAATLGSCVTRMTVIPSALSCWNIRRISTLVCESRLPVGSSARTSAGWFTSERAMATRCCCPPDICDGSWSLRSARPTRSSKLLGQLAGLLRGGPVRRVVQRHHDVLQRRGARQEVEALEDEAQLLGPHQRPLVRRQAAHLLAVEPELAGAGPVEAAQDVHQRGLARAGGPHQGHHFAPVDRERHARAAPARRPRPGDTSCRCFRVRISSMGAPVAYCLLLGLLLPPLLPLLPPDFGASGILRQERVGIAAAGGRGRLLADDHLHPFLHVRPGNLGHRPVAQADADPDRADELAVADPEPAVLVVLFRRLRSRGRLRRRMVFARGSRDGSVLLARALPGPLPARPWWEAARAGGAPGPAAPSAIGPRRHPPGIVVVRPATRLSSWHPVQSGRFAASNAAPRWARAARSGAARPRTSRSP